MGPLAKRGPDELAAQPFPPIPAGLFRAQWDTLHAAQETVSDEEMMRAYEKALREAGIDVPDHFLQVVWSMMIMREPTESPEILQSITDEQLHNPGLLIVLQDAHVQRTLSTPEGQDALLQTVIITATRARGLLPE